jgi:hypothetical protein
MSIVSDQINYLVHLNTLQYCNIACVTPIGKALHVSSNVGITMKASTVLVKSLCGIKEGSVDTDSSILVQDILQTWVLLCTGILIAVRHAWLCGSKSTHRNLTSVHCLLQQGLPIPRSQVEAPPD